MMTSASNVALVSMRENSFDQNKSNSGLIAYNREGNDSCPHPNFLLWSSRFLRKLMMTSASNVALVSMRENSFDQNKSNSGLIAYNREGNDSCPPPQIYKYTSKEQYFVVVI